jgi:hypothetical protein
MPRSRWPRKTEEPEIRRFQEACMAWASQSQISLNKVFIAAGKKKGSTAVSFQQMTILPGLA